MNRTVLLSALFATALGAVGMSASAFAQDAISTRPAQEPSQAAIAAAVASADAAPPTDADAPTRSQVDGARWGHEVLDRAAGKLPPTDDRRDGDQLAQAGDANGKGCVRNPDRAPHGTMGVGMGTGGYRSADVFVTQPVGDCGQVSIGLSTSRWGGRGRGF